MNIIHSVINHNRTRHSRESGNPGKHWIPPYQVRGMLSQARNDKQVNICAVMCENYSILKNQSGAALVIALIMMIVLTLIGLASIFSSTFEIKISGNKRGSTDAFYSADSGVQVLKVNVQNFSSNNSNPYNPFTDLANPNPTNPGNATATITYNAAQQGAPRGYGFSATNFEFQYFLIASTGNDRTDLNPFRSTCTIQEKVVRLIPTTQGGS